MNKQLNSAFNRPVKSTQTRMLAGAVSSFESNFESKILPNRSFKA